MSDTLAGFVTARQLGCVDVVLTLLSAPLGPLLLVPAARSLFESAICARCPRGPQLLALSLAVGRPLRARFAPVHVRDSGKLLLEGKLGMLGRQLPLRRSEPVAGFCCRTVVRWTFNVCRMVTQRWKRD